MNPNVEHLNSTLSLSKKNESKYSTLELQIFSLFLPISCVNFFFCFEYVRFVFVLHLDLGNVFIMDVDDWNQINELNDYARLEE